MKRLIILLFAITACISAIAQNKKNTDDDLTFIKKVLSDKVYFADLQIDIDTLAWNPHPKFKGVCLKHLVLGKNTKNQLSCHIVKIEPNCTLDTHLHDGKIEIHEVVGGGGTMYLDGKEISYQTGRICVIPANTLHKISAGKNGLYLFAQFSPALQ